jgi:hypothetical protein
MDKITSQTDSCQSPSQKDFLSTLFPANFLSDNYIEIRELPRGTQRFFTSPAEIVEAIRGSDQNITFGVAMRSREGGSDKDVSLVTSLWTDIDLKDFSGDVSELKHSIDQFPIQPSIQIDSGNGVHLYWLLKKPIIVNDETSRFLRGLLLGITKSVGGDVACRNLSRVMRMPGTQNAKQNGKMVAITECDDPKPCCVLTWHPDRRYDLSDFEELYIEDQPLSNTKVDLSETSFDEVPARFLQLIETDPELANAWRGNRTPPNDRTCSGYDAMLTAMLVSREFTDDEIAAVVRAYPFGKGSEATIQYLNRTIANARGFCDDVGNGGDPKQTPTDEVAGEYRIRDGGMGYMKHVGRGSNSTLVFAPLCNFAAKVISDTSTDDGAEVKRSFSVAIVFDDEQRVPPFEVVASLFPSMNWVMQNGGVKAVIVAGQSAKDRLRECIQKFSGDAEKLYRYGHTGWRFIDGQWTFLHAGRTDVDVHLDNHLKRYALPEKPERIDEAIEQSLSLLKTGPDEVMIPLLSSVYLAPLSSFLKPDFVLFMVGVTGSLKSSLAALFLSHYGNFRDKSDLPASWESTDNALEHRLFILKDVLCVVDDYAPRSDALSQRRQEGRAQRIIRSIGNQSARSRLRSDLTERPEYTPRGLMISTGEDLPPGQSIQARTLVLEVDGSQLDLEALSEAQRAADLLPHAIGAYVEWLAPQLPHITEELKEQWSKYRSLFMQADSHKRIPEILANMMIGVNLFTSFANTQGVISTSQVEEMRQRSFKTLVSLGVAHSRRIKEEDPAEVFLNTLNAMLAQESVQLASRTSFREEEDIIGWKDDDYAYLIPQAAMKAVYKFVQDSGGHFPYSNGALYKSLDRRDALIKTSNGRPTPQVKVQGRNRRVLQIPLRLILPPMEEAETGWVANQVASL